MATRHSNECNLQVNSAIDKVTSKKTPNEHAEQVKNDQMAEKNNIPIDDLNEVQLKSLLDEAISFKNPRDLSAKSDTFKLLLKNATEEDEREKERFGSFGEFGLKQSNSLQNLIDDTHYQLQTHLHTSGKKQRRKNSTSVSTRRLEGGSLPIDMHHSSSAVQSPPDQPFLSEYRKKRKEDKKQQQQKDTVIDMGDDGVDDKKSFACHNKDSISSSYLSDAVEMKSLSYTNSVDLEVQDTSKFAQANSMPTSITTMAPLTSGGSSTANATMVTSKVTSFAGATASSVHSVIELPLNAERTLTAKSYQQQHQLHDLTGSTINHNNNIVVANHALNFAAAAVSGKTGVDTTPLQLGSTYNAVSSLTQTDKSNYGFPKNYKPSLGRDEVTHPSALIPTPMTLPAPHVSSVSNTKETKAAKKRTAKSERNEKKIDVTSIEGYRGTAAMDELLKYIDGDNGGKHQKNHPKNGIVSGANDHLLSAEEKKKKMAAKNKEKVNKLKKSNSMDELCSTVRHQHTSSAATPAAATTKISVPDSVTLRSKSSNVTSGAKKGDKSQQKRNERRSWGTEGLWTAENQTPVASIGEQKDTMQDESPEIESFSSSSSSGIPSDPKTITTTIEPIMNSTIESAEFHVVTKKRKVKRKSSEGADVALNKTTVHNLQGYEMRRDGAHARGAAKSYNDRDKSSRNSKNPINYDGHKATTGKNRRKSTSSMPPSDEGEYSDGGDSVQSLPIETTKSLLISSTSNVDSSSSKGTIINSNNSNSSTTATTTTSTNKKSQHNSNQHQQKSTTFSYADIAKTNANRNTVPSATDKWPSVSASAAANPSSLSSSSTITSNNNSTHPSNDPFAITNFSDAINNNNQQSNINIKQQQQQHQKSLAPATVTGNIVPPSMLSSFPELVETNNNRNKQLNNNPDHTSNVDGNVPIEWPVNGIIDGMRPTYEFLSDDRINNNQTNKISYSQLLLEKSTTTTPGSTILNNHQDVIAADANGNNLKFESNSTVTPNGTMAGVVTQKATLVKSKSVDHNNLSSIEHYPALEKTKITLSDVMSKPAENLSLKNKPTKIQSKIEDNVKRGKKDKLTIKKGLVTSNVQFQQTTVSNHNYRPAVIILNDDCEKTGDVDGITFGFGIDEHLLLGHPLNGDDHCGGDEANIIVDGSNDSLENNNNNNCDIINTNLSNNLTNQSTSSFATVGDMYENFIVPQSVVTNINNCSGGDHISQQSSSSSLNHHVMAANSQSSSPKQEHHQHLDTSNQSSNDLGYLSSSFVTNDATSPTSNLKSSSSAMSINDELVGPMQTNIRDGNEKPLTRDVVIVYEDAKKDLKFDNGTHLILPKFVSPEPVRFNQDELVTFISDEWTKFSRNAMVFNGQ